MGHTEPCCLFLRHRWDLGSLKAQDTVADKDSQALFGYIRVVLAEGVGMVSSQQCSRMAVLMATTSSMAGVVSDCLVHARTQPGSSIGYYTSLMCDWCALTDTTPNTALSNCERQANKFCLLNFQNFFVGSLLCYSQGGP